MRWKIQDPPSAEIVSNLQQELGVDRLTATLLAQRGICSFSEARDFFRPSFEKLHSPWLMKDMEAAVARIEQAMANGERIMVYGDYDVDGTTSVALMSSWLLQYHPEVETYIPDRYEEGYGVSYQGIDLAFEKGISLIIALDCGIKAIDKVAYAREKGIDFVICDHHTPGESLPDAVAILDPKRKDCEYPYKELCGCGVGFKLLQALQERRGGSFEALIPWLDLVATAIAADIVPITGENRVLTALGLEVINQNPRPGIYALTAQLKRPLNISNVVFVIAPRINAAGRMKHGLHAVRLLTESDISVAMEYAGEIEQYNADRRSCDQEITQEALKLIGELQEEDRFTTVVYQEHWHKGVIGIVASRLTETYYRPTLVFTKSGNKLAASARSVKNFDLYAALQACEDCLEQFGGHKYAAGLTLREEQYEPFKQRFEEVVSASIDPELLVPEIYVDAVLNLEEITPKFYRILKQFAPFGPGNDAPLFMATGLTDTGWGKTVGEDGKHLKLNVQQGEVRISAIGFNLGHKLPLVSDKKSFSAVFSVEENEWNGTVSLQLNLKDIREL